jgi:predicted transcriptional regulator
MPISLDEAKNLPQEKSAGIGAEALVEELSKNAMSASEISDFLGVKKAGVYTKLKRLEENGIIKRVFKDDVAYWYAEATAE